MDIDEVLRAQDGVLTRRQVLECGGDDNAIERRIRRREWARVHTGVFVDHTGPPTWRQRAWAAVLVHWPAALAAGSALRAEGLTRHSNEEDDIEVVVAAGRNVESPDGVRSSTVSGFEDAARLNKSPPRMSLEHAILSLASRATTEDAAVAALADVCQSRRTTPARLVEALDLRPRLPRRGLLRAILADVADGAYSALERRFLIHVERPHGLPTGRRQRRVRPGKTIAYRDVDYLELGVVVELDGRLGHEDASDRWADLDRDLDGILAGDLTVRVGWKQALQPCRLAAALARLLQARGWTGVPRPCGPHCPIHDL
ncbi:MAG: hypothetical protein WKF79_15415 [Nocardioides sp.]